MKRSGSWMDAILRMAPRARRASNAEVETEVGLWSAHDAAAASCRDAADASGRAAAASVRARKAAEAVTQGARGAVARIADARAPVTRLADTLDRLRLLALNVALEGSRSSEAASRVLGLVGDDVRAHVERAADALRELEGTLGELDESVSATVDQSESMLQQHADIVAEADAARSHADRSCQHVDELGRAARVLSRSDPETVRVVGRTIEHARALLSDLAELRVRARPSVLRSALRPIAIEIVRALRDLVDAPEPDAGQSRPV